MMMRTEENIRRKQERLVQIVDKHIIYNGHTDEFYLGQYRALEWVLGIGGSSIDDDD